MAFQPGIMKDFPTLATSTGNVTSTVIYKTTVAGLHRVAIYVAPQTASTILGSVTATIGWTDGGIVRTWTSNVLSLLTLSGLIQSIIPVRCDINTNITYSLTVTGTSGTYSATFGVRAP